MAVAESAMQRSSSGTIAGIGVALFGIIVSLLLVELIFRLAFSGHLAEQRSDRPGFYYRPQLATSMQGNVYLVPKPANTFRIGIVGDSITFAPNLQFDDTFSKRLERMLNLNKTDKRAEVINYGVPGLSTINEINFIKKAISDQCDLVILQITLNDPEVEALSQLREDHIKRFGPYKPGPFMESVISYWKSLGFVLARLHNANSQRAYRDYFLDLFENPKTFGPFQDALKSIGAIGTEAKIPLVAVVFPLLGFPLDDKYPFQSLHQKTAQALEQAKIPGLDLYGRFQDIPLQRLQVIPNVDLHPGEIAHRIAAESIYSWLNEIKLIPEELSIKSRFRGRLDRRAVALK